MNCENYDTSVGNQTVLTVEGTYTSGDREGITVSHEIDFGTMQIKRNYLYKVRIALEGPAGDTYGKVTHAINVKDWTSGITLAWAGDENLYNNSLAANYTITGTANNWTTSEGVDRHLVLPYNAEMSATFYVESTSTKSGLNLTCPATALAATVEEGGGYQCTIGTPEMTYNEDGQFVQKWPVTVRQSAFANGAVLTFTLQNALNASLSTTFEVTGVEPNTPTFSLLANGASDSETSANVKASAATDPETIWSHLATNKVTLEVQTKGGAILAIDDASEWTNTESSVILSDTKSISSNGLYTQEVTFQMSSTLGNTVNFTLKNAVLPTDESLWQTFKVYVRPKLPLEYMAQGVIKNGSADSDGSWEQDYTQTQGYNFTYANMTSIFGSGFRSYYIENGKKYTVSCHVPTRAEWYGIVPQTYSDMQDHGTGVKTASSQTATIGDFHLTGFGDATTQTGGNNYATDADMIYAIRFTGAQWEGQTTASNLWKTACRYTLMGSIQCTRIEFVYLGPDDTTTINNINNSSWWSGKSVVTRYIPWYPNNTGGVATSKVNTGVSTGCWAIDNSGGGFLTGSGHLSVTAVRGNYTSAGTDNFVMPFTDE